jgi:hypothetical protein
MKASHIIAFVVLLALTAGGTYYFVSRKNKGTATTTTEEEAGTTVQQPTTVSTTTSYSGAQMVALAKRLHTDMVESGGWFQKARDHEAWQRFVAMADQYVVGVNAAFNSLYKSEGKGSFTTWIKDEYSLGGTDEGYTKQQLLTRLYDLNLY